MQEALKAREPMTPEQVRDGIANWIDENIKHREFWTPEVVDLICSIEINGGKPYENGRSVITTRKDNT